MPSPTISVRKAIKSPELWLNAKGQWDKYENRKLFRGKKNQLRIAANFIEKHLGKGFEGYCIFENSERKVEKTYHVYLTKAQINLIHTCLYKARSQPTDAKRKALAETLAVIETSLVITDLED